MEFPGEVLSFTSENVLSALKLPPPVILPDEYTYLPDKSNVCV